MALKQLKSGDQHRFERRAGLFHTRERLRSTLIGSSRLRKALYMPAVVARRHNPLIFAFCDRPLAKGKSKMSVIGAAMHKLLRLVFGALKSQKPFNPYFLPISP
jgi:transposase